MSTTERIWEDVVALHVSSKEFIGEFIYEPFGITASETLTSVTLYVGLAVIAMVFWRLSRPVHHARYRHPVNEYDFGRNV